MVSYVVFVLKLFSFFKISTSGYYGLKEEHGQYDSVLQISLSPQNYPDLYCIIRNMQSYSTLSLYLGFLKSMASSLDKLKFEGKKKL